MNTRFLSVVFLSLFFNIAIMYGQQELPKIIPPSPNAAALAQYGEFPVNMATGTPSISIPLYQVQSRQLQMPISLSYHASGIKVAQKSSNVGLGWALNIGGVITRSVVDIPDEITNGYGNIANTLPGADDLGDIATAAEQAVLEDLENHKDLEPDIFNYNFNGRSGQFKYTKNGDLTPVPYEDIKIAFITDGLQITDEMGTVYRFKDKETVNMPESTYGILYTSSWYLTEIISSDGSEKIEFIYEDGGYLLERLLNDTETLRYVVYGTNAAGESNGFRSLSSQTPLNGKQNYTLRLKEVVFPYGKINLDYLARPDTWDSGDGLHNLTIYKSSLITNGIYSTLKSFVFNQGIFPEKNCSEASAIETEKKRSRLDSVDEKDKNGNVVRTWGFTYNNALMPCKLDRGVDDWGYYNGANNTTLVNSEKALEGFSVIPLGTANRDANPSVMQVGMLQRIDYPTGGYTEFEFEPHQIISGSTINKTKYAVALNGIGGNAGSTIFTAADNISATYEVDISAGYTNTEPAVTIEDLTASTSDTYYGHQDHTQSIEYTGTIQLISGHQYKISAVAPYTGTVASGYIRWTESVPAITPLGGLRVKSIVSYKGADAKAFEKHFTYGTNEDGVGTLLANHFGFVNHTDYFEYNNVHHAGACVHVGKTLTRTIVSSDLYKSSSFSGSPVIYPKVYEYQGTPENNTGKTERSYEIFPDEVLLVNPSVGGSNGTIYPEVSYKNGVFQLEKDWKRGQMKSEHHYKNNEGTYVPVASTIHDYEDFKHHKDSTIYVKRFGGFDGTPCYPIVLNMVFDFPIEFGARKRTRTVNTQYDVNGQNPVETTQEFFYESPHHLQVTRTKTTNSLGETIETHTQYPDDVIGQSTLGYDDLNIAAGELAAINRLKENDLHKVATPVQTSTYKDTDGDGTMEASELLGVQRTLYKDWSSDVVLPKEIQSLKGVYNSSTNSLENRIVYHDYDDIGNPIELSKADGTHIYYIWGYNGQYPIAKLENFTSSQITSTVQNLIDVAVTASNNDNSVSTENSLRIALGNLRDTPALIDTMVSTYTYDPLIGITSITDPKEYTMYYEYDDFNRLKQVKDADGKILSKNQYHYKGQQ